MTGGQPDDRRPLYNKNNLPAFALAGMVIRINGKGYPMTLDLDFMATCRGGLVKLRADCVKMRDKRKALATKAHYQAIIDAIDARQ